MNKTGNLIAATLMLVCFSNSEARSENVYTGHTDYLLGTLINLTSGIDSNTAYVEYFRIPPESPPSFTLTNNTFRTVRMAIYSDYQEKWAYVELAPYDVWQHWNASDEPALIQVQVWNGSKNKWVGKDTDYIGWQAVGEAYKLAKREYRFRIWRHLR